MSLMQGIWTTSGTTSPEPVYSLEVLVFCAESQKGLVGNAARPQAFTRPESSVFELKMGELDTTFMTVYWAEALGAKNAKKQVPARIKKETRPNKRSFMPPPSDLS
jgi:hypothetical protein